MKQRRWPRAVLAAALTTIALAIWRVAFSPVAGEGTFLPWTVLGLIVAVATISTDHVTRPFIGIATTAAAAVLANLISGGRQGLDPVRLSDALYLAPAAAVLALAVTALHQCFLDLPRARRPWARVVVVLGGSAWVTWIGWWPLSETDPAHPAVLLTAAACTVLTATVLGEVTLGTWQGAVHALGPAALLAGPPLVTSDSLGIILWVMFVAAAAAGCLVAVGVVAAIRGAHRRGHLAPR